MRSIHVVAELLPKAWETAVIRCWQEGAPFATQYDKPNDPPSRDVLAVIHVIRPFGEPRIHRAFPCGLADLEKYRAEVLYGVHDYWMNDTTNPNRWQYTYHQRLFDYATPDGQRIDQIARCVAMLKECGHTRRAQAVTWQAWADPGIHDPPCLQRLWFRIEQGRLNLVAHMRSNDAYKAAFMNMYAFTELQKDMAEQVGVEPGEYVHVADSFHIYGSYFSEFEGFLRLAEQRSDADKAFTTEYAADFFIEGCDELLAEPNMPQRFREKVLARKRQLLSLSGLQNMMQTCHV